MTKEDKYTGTILGIMSGTSTDGLDMAICKFHYLYKKWQYKLLSTHTQPYSDRWQNKLNKASLLSGLDLQLLDIEYGKWIAQQAVDFIQQSGYLVEAIASHGHTVFHQPEKGLTLQIGNGYWIHAITKLPVVYDFRSLDVAKGGQGAPLVPAGDRYLFSDYNACLNLGGFANISFNKNGKRIAYDICPVNIILNDLARYFGEAMDINGELGKKGHIDQSLLSKLNNLLYYRLSYPKSLSREWLQKEFITCISTKPDVNTIRTVYEHIATQLSNEMNRFNYKHILVTGGGTFNTFLIELLQKHCITELIIPDAELINYKEALVFAFLGLLRLHKQVNCFASVTGAKSDSSCGTISP